MLFVPVVFATKALQPIAAYRSVIVSSGNAAVGLQLCYSRPLYLQYSNRPKNNVFLLV